MNALFCHLPLVVLGLFHVSLSAADQALDRPVNLGGRKGLGSGTLLQEKREVRVTEGKGQIQPGANFSCRFVQRVDLVRRLLGSDREEVLVRGMACEMTNYTGKIPPPSNERPGPLVNQKLRARNSAGRWEYTLAQGKPTPEQQKLLSDLAFTALLLEIPVTCLNNQIRKVGEMWKTNIEAPRGKADGWIVADGVESTLVAMEDRPDGRHATVHFTGSFRMERPMNFASKIDVSFDGTIVRRLTDMLDVDMKIAGRFRNQGAVNDLQGKPAQLILELPYTLARTLSIEGK